MASLKDRACRLRLFSTVTGGFGMSADQMVEVEGLRVEFSIRKTLAKEPNEATITVTNAAEFTRSAMQNKGSQLTLEAGYAQTFGLIFHGDIRHVDHAHEGPEWKSKITCGDGERAYRHARLNKSWRGSVPAGTIVSAACQAMGIGTGNLRTVIAQLNKSAGYRNGYVARSAASRELDCVLRAAGYEWSIQDGQLQIARPNDRPPGSLILSPDSGLVGSPTHGTPSKKGKSPVLKLRTLLMPELLPGSLVRVESAQHRGDYKLIELTHVGDSAGGDWYTDSEAEKL